MKLTIILITICCLHASAISYSQTITISEKNAPLKKVLFNIRKQAGYQLLYDSGLLKKSKSVTVNMVNAPIAVILDEIFNNQPFSYSLSDKTILIKEKDISLIKNDVITITGTVTDQLGKPISLASIKVKGRNKTVVTDVSGKFAIVVPNEGATLVVSYVGFVTTEIASKQGITIVLQPNLNNLEEMVVVGYGSTKRKDLTGSVSSVDVKEIKNAPFMSFDNALAGKAAGVQVIKADGAPGGAVRIRIRGGTSLIGSNDPLYIIDGIPVTVDNKFVSVTDMTNPMENYGGEQARNSGISGSFARGLNNLSGLNMDDIESIDILKDASATAIYGSKAANGVVIITTKKGRLNEKPTLELNYYGGYTTARTEKVLNRDQYLMVLKEAAQNRVIDRKSVV